MGLYPKIEKKKNFLLKKCNLCGQSFGPGGFAKTKSIFYPDGCLPFCNDCIDEYLETKDDDQKTIWEKVDKLCQMVDIPFSPKEWQNIYDMNPIGAFGRYTEVFLGTEYENFGWADYYQAFKRLREKGLAEKELPELREARLNEQRKRWGANYDEEAMDYLDQLYNGLLATQNVNGTLQTDQAIKICKLSYLIDCRIRDGADFDKVLGAYDKMVKIGEFTPKNVKNINDFDTIGELVKWFEKRGWRAKYFDKVNRDIVDETMKNIQTFNQRLYTNESGIGEQITNRIEMLKMAEKLASKGDYEAEGYFLDKTNYDLDNYENDGYEELLKKQVFEPGDSNE